MRLHRHFAVFGAAMSTDRHADAIAYANQLLGRSPVTRSELLVRIAPADRLLKTPLIISSNQVERRAFWISTEPMNATFAALKTQLTGRPVGSDGSPRRNREVDVEEVRCASGGATWAGIRRRGKPGRIHSDVPCSRSQMASQPQRSGVGDP
jgi:hypothetical protein